MHEGELTRKTALARSDLDDDEQARSAATPLRSISLLHLAVDEDLHSCADLTSKGTSPYLYRDFNIILPGEDHNTAARSVRCRQTEGPLKNLLTVFPRINKHRGGAAAVHSVAAA